jgi:hypothetical protein
VSKLKVIPFKQNFPYLPIEPISLKNWNVISNKQALLTSGTAAIFGIGNFQLLDFK